MIDEEFIRFVGGVFPSISPDDRKAALEALRKEPPSAADLFAVVLPSELCQGDIIKDLPFIVTNEYGRAQRSVLPGMLLSHSCDLDNGDEFVTFAPVFPFSAFRDNPGIAGYLRRNRITNRLFIPDVSGLGEQVVDFARAHSFHVATIDERLKKDSRCRQTSFTNLGYYFLITKLAIHFLRPQAADEARGEAARRGISRRERWRFVVSQARHLLGVIWGLRRAE